MGLERAGRLEEEGCRGISGWSFYMSANRMGIVQEKVIHHL